jgi:hypothetical protein
MPRRQEQDALVIPIREQVDVVLHWDGKTYRVGAGQVQQIQVQREYDDYGGDPSVTKPPVTETWTVVIRRPWRG